jgi:hypothetical protein
MFLQAGMKLYRGSLENETTNQGQWFTNNLHDASVYGDVSEYEIKESISVLDMGKGKNIIKLSKLFPEYAKKHGINPSIFDQSFYLDDAGVPQRHSEFKSDTIITEFVAHCQAEGAVDENLKGFGAAPMAPSHHWEVFFHSPPAMQRVKQIPITPERKRAQRMQRRDNLQRQERQQEKRAMHRQKRTGEQTKKKKVVMAISFD